jgi:hypothetical protein
VVPSSFPQLLSPGLSHMVLLCGFVFFLLLSFFC